nr:unnamed protein product [Spirometra erinaceieuropaei]
MLLLTSSDAFSHAFVSALPVDIATDLCDIIDFPPTEALDTALKEALISRITPSKQIRLQCLISEEDLGEGKATQLLRRLEQLGDGQKLNATMFKQLFLRRLPPSVQAILASNIPSSTVQMLTETADRIPENYQPPVTVNVANRSEIAPTIEDVIRRVYVLTVEVSQLRATRVFNSLNPAITRARDLPLQINLQLIASVVIILIMVPTHIAVTLRASTRQLRWKTPLPSYKDDERNRHILSHTYDRTSCRNFFVDTVVEAFNRAREALVDTNALVHPIPDAPLSVVADASNFAYSPHEARYLDFISQYTTDIRLLKGLYNQVADCLSRPGINAITRPYIDLECMAGLQNQSTSTENLQHTSLQLEAIPLSTTPVQSCVTYRAVLSNP